MKTKNKAVIKLSPQEALLFNALKFAKRATVTELYRIVQQTTYKQVERVPARRRQLHLGSLVRRINTKQVKFVIRPGDEPSTYRMTRR